MKIGIHQPNFIPWMGYFHKIANCDIFVLLDHVEFTKKSFTKRVKIHKSNNLEEERYLVVPLQKHSDHASIDSLQLVNNDSWQKKISAQIHQSYGKAPYYFQIEPLLDSFFRQGRSNTSFSDLNIEIIKYVTDMLELNTQFITSSALDISYSGKDVNLDIVSFLNGKTYVSGMGAKKYQDEKVFIKNDINLEYSNFPTLFKNLEIPDHFLNKSIISYLACFSIDEVKEILKKSIKV